MKRPAFQFYPGDWQRNANLRRCSPAARGVWVDIMCLLHDSDEYGVLRWPLADIAQAAGAQLSLVRELVQKQVFKGADEGQCPELVYVPRSGRVDGNPVTLIAAQMGPIWYSSRMVKDEYVRNHAGSSTRFGAKDAAAKDVTRKQSSDSERSRLRAAVFSKTGGVCWHCKCALPGRWEIDHLVPRSKGGSGRFYNLVPSCVRCNQDKSDTMPDDWADIQSSLSYSPSRRRGEDLGDGSSSASATAVNSEPNGSGGKPPDRDWLFSVGLGMLAEAGQPEKQARRIIGMWCSKHGDDNTLSAMQDVAKRRPADPIAAVQAKLTGTAAKRGVDLVKGWANELTGGCDGDTIEGNFARVP